MFVILQVVKIVFLKSRRLSGLGPRRNTFRTKLSNVEQTGWFGPKKCHCGKVNRQITSCLHPVSDGLPSFAWLQHFAVCLPFSASCELRELEQQNHTATHTHAQGMLIVWARSMGMTYFLGSAPWTATAAHVNSPNGPLHPPKCVIFVGGVR